MAVPFLRCVVFLQQHQAEMDEIDLDLSVALGATKNAMDRLVAQR